MSADTERFNIPELYWCPSHGEGVYSTKRECVDCIRISLMSSTLILIHRQLLNIGMMVDEIVDHSVTTINEIQKVREDFPESW